MNIFLEFFYSPFEIVSGYSLFLFVYKKVKKNEM